MLRSILLKIKWQAVYIILRNHDGLFVERMCNT